MNRSLISLTIIALLFLMSGCGGDNAGPVNSVSIVSVTPSSAPVGEPTNFTFTIEYDLQTAETAGIFFCFKRIEELNADMYWQGCPAPIVPPNVNKGSGAATFEITETLTEPSYLQVFLSPLGTPFAEDRQLVTVEQ